MGTLSTTVENRSHNVRLLDYRTQETYFSKIMERYGQIQSNSGPDNYLNDAFPSLSLDGQEQGYVKVIPSRGNAFDTSMDGGHSLKTASEISTMLMAMRKIREAIVASGRKDVFASKVYAFIIRSTILVGHMESYHPALLHLLHEIHPVAPLLGIEFREFLGYQILDLACRQKDLAAAYQVKCSYRYKDPNIEAVLKALVHGNWSVFWFVHGLVGAQTKRLMQWAGDGIRTHALNCLGKSYLSVEKKYLEIALHKRWEEIEEKKSLGWQQDGNMIIIRKIGRK